MAYKEVQGLSKGLSILQALNRFPDGMGFVGDLAQTCGLHRTTTKRLLETLCANGVVRHGESAGQYCLTSRVRSLSEGFLDEEWVEKVASPLMRSAAFDLMWWCDLSTLTGVEMVVRESTHRWSHLSQLRAMIGQRMPLLTTAVGRAYLAWAPKEEVAVLLDLLKNTAVPDARLAQNPRQISRLLTATRKRGYSTNWGEWSPYPHVSAVGIPVHSGTKLIGAMTLGFWNNAISTAELHSRFLPKLKNLAESIGNGSSRWFSGR